MTTRNQASKKLVGQTSSGPVKSTQGVDSRSTSASAVVAEVPASGSAPNSYADVTRSGSPLSSSKSRVGKTPVIPQSSASLGGEMANSPPSSPSLDIGMVHSKPHSPSLGVGLVSPQHVAAPPLSPTLQEITRPCPSPATVCTGRASPPTISPFPPNAVAAILHRIDDLVHQVRVANQDELARTTVDLAQTKEDITVVNERVTHTKKELQAIHTTVAEVSNKRDITEAKVMVINAQVTGLTTDLQIVNTRLDNTYMATTTLKDRITGCEENGASFQTRMREGTNRMAMVMKDVQSLQVSTETCSDRISVVEARLDTMITDPNVAFPPSSDSQQVTPVHTAVEQAKTRITALDRKVDIALQETRGTIFHLQQQLNQLKEAEPHLKRSTSPIVDRMALFNTVQGIEVTIHSQADQLVTVHADLLRLTKQSATMEGLHHTTATLLQHHEQKILNIQQMQTALASRLAQLTAQSETIKRVEEQAANARAQSRSQSPSGGTSARAPVVLAASDLTTLSNTPSPARRPTVTHFLNDRMVGTHNGPAGDTSTHPSHVDLTDQPLQGSADFPPSPPDSPSDPFSTSHRGRSRDEANARRQLGSYDPDFPLLPTVRVLNLADKHAIRKTWKDHLLSKTKLVWGNHEPKAIAEVLDFELKTIKMLTFNFQTATEREAVLPEIVQTINQHGANFGVDAPISTQQFWEEFHRFFYGDVYSANDTLCAAAWHLLLAYGSLPAMEAMVAMLRSCQSEAPFPQNLEGYLYKQFRQFLSTSGNPSHNTALTNLAFAPTYKKITSTEDLVGLLQLLRQHLPHTLVSKSPEPKRPLPRPILAPMTSHIYEDYPPYDDEQYMEEDLQYQNTITAMAAPQDNRRFNSRPDYRRPYNARYSQGPNQDGYHRWNRDQAPLSQFPQETGNEYPKATAQGTYSEPNKSITFSTTPPDAHRQGGPRGQPYDRNSQQTMSPPASVYPGNPNGSISPGPQDPRYGQRGPPSNDSGPPPSKGNNSQHNLPSSYGNHGNQGRPIQQYGYDRNNSTMATSSPDTNPNRWPAANGTPPTANHIVALSDGQEFDYGSFLHDPNETPIH